MRTPPIPLFRKEGVRGCPVGANNYSPLPHGIDSGEAVGGAHPTVGCQDARQAGTREGRPYTLRRDGGAGGFLLPGVWGCPPFSFISPEIGGLRGLI